MRLVLPQRGGGRLDRQRHLAAAIAAQMRIMPDQLWVARDKPGAQPGGARPLRQGMEHDNVVEAVAERRARFECAGWRRAVVDLGVAFVHRQHEIVFAGQRDRLLQVVEGRDRALRVRRRAQVKQRGAFESLARDRGEIGHEAVVSRRVEKHRFRAGHRRRAVVDEVIGVRHQHDRLPAALFARHDEAGKQVEPFLGAGEGQDVAVGIERAGRQAVAPVEPSDDRLAQFRGAGHRRVLVPFVGMRGQRRGQQRRRLMLRLAQ